MSGSVFNNSSASNAHGSQILITGLLLRLAVPYLDRYYYFCTAVGIVAAPCRYAATLHGFGEALLLYFAVSTTRS